MRALLIAVLVIALASLGLSATTLTVVLTQRQPQAMTILSVAQPAPFYRSEAEALTRLGRASSLSDVAASDGHAVVAWTNGDGGSTSVTVPSSVSGTYTVTVGAREDAYNGNAHLSLYLDGSHVGGTYVTATGGYQAYELPVHTWTGTHTLRVTFDNDAYGGSRSTDGNLYLDWIAVSASGAAVTPVATSAPASPVAVSTPALSTATTTPAPSSTVTPAPSVMPAPSATTVPPTSAPTTAPTAASTSAPSGAPTVPATTGTHYYVDCSGGSDSNNGTSPSSAWQSLAKANAAPLSTGDGLYFKRGCTWTGTLTLSHSGTATQPIVIGAYGSGALPMLQTGAAGSVIVSFTGSYITVDSLAAHALPPVIDPGCQNNPKGWLEGCAFRSGATYDVVQNSEATGGWAGADVQSGAAHEQIVYDRFSDNTMMSPLDTTSKNDAGAFGVVLHGDSSTVAHNTITGSHACSYDYTSDGSAVEIYGGQHNIVAFNVAREDDAFSELGNARTLDTTYAYNVYTSSLDKSIFVNTRGANDSYGPVNGTKAYNNSVYLTGAHSQGFVCGGGCSGAILVMRNNVIQAAWKAGYADGPFDEDHDLFWGGTRQFTLGPHSKVAAPLFVNAGGGDLHLQAGSLAVGLGVPLGYTTDLDGHAVPHDHSHGRGHGHGRGYGHGRGHHKHKKD